MLIGFSSLVHKAKFLLNENSTTILTGVGVTGTVATAYLTGRATFKAAKILQDVEAERRVFTEETPANGTVLAIPEPKALTKIRLVWRLYLPPFAVGITTVTSIIAANKIASKKIAALAVASGISERALQEYKAKVVEKLGEKQEQAVRDEIAQDRVDKQPVGREIIIAGSGEVLCYDMLTGRYFTSTVENIKRAENKINHDLNNFMSASASEFYDELGLPPTTYTDNVGWNANEHVKVRLSATLSSDQRPCMAIDFENPPFPDYARHYD